MVQVYRILETLYNSFIQLEGVGAGGYTTAIGIWQLPVPEYGTWLTGSYLFLHYYPSAAR